MAATAEPDNIRVSLSGTSKISDTVADPEYVRVNDCVETTILTDGRKKGHFNKYTAVCLLFTVIVMLVAIVVGVTLGLTRVMPPQYVPGIDVSCILQGQATYEKCQELGCLWKEKEHPHAPWCTYPLDHQRYVLDSDSVTETDRGMYMELTAKPGGSHMYGPQAQNITVSVEYQTDNRLRVKIYDNKKDRYEVPEAALNITAPALPPTNRQYDVDVRHEPFGIIVRRIDNGAVVFNSSTPGFLFMDQLLQVTIKLPSAHLYGLGEHNHRQYKHDMNWRNWTIFTRDVAPVDDWNLYGAQTLYMNLEDDGKANGVFLLNSNAMDIQLHPDPYPAITYRVIGGVLDFYIFLGPTPENVVEQYTHATGRPLMPPYWALGFQLSRWHYGSLANVSEVVQRNREAGIPQDVQYGDIDYMVNKMDFTYDPETYAELPEFVQDLHDNGQRYIIILDHCIASNASVFADLPGGTYPPYTKGLLADVFIKDGRDPSKNLKGEVWPGEVVYPDFTKGQVVKDWWKELCKDFFVNQSVEYDALWIDMNEPSNFVQGSTTGCDNNTYNYPPYTPNVLGAQESGMMYDKTICMDSVQDWGKHYDVHSLYGHSMSIVTHQTLSEMFPGKRPFVLTRSNFAGTQKYAMHWLGDNQSQWRQIPWSVVGMLEYSLFGFSYTGADICGFWYATTEEMCIRWMLLGAFYPFARNHNAIGWRDQDPAAFGEPMIRIARNILLTRYKLLPYLYTLMHKANVYGSTVVRPMLHEFTYDKKTWSVDKQFMWGPALLITPVMDEGQNSVSGYFPVARWYNYYTGEELVNPGTQHTLDTPLDSINLHVRGGNIIPWQMPANSTVYSRKNPMGLIVALGDAPEYRAAGFLFWDDGESNETFSTGDYLTISFNCENFVLNMTVLNEGYNPPDGGLAFDSVSIFGLSRVPKWITVDGAALGSDKWTYEESYGVLELATLGLNITTNHVITWALEV